MFSIKILLLREGHKIIGLTFDGIVKVKARSL